MRPAICPSDLADHGLAPAPRRGPRVHACSVAFRHHRISAAGLAAYVTAHGFDGVEIWSPHARALAEDWQALPARPDVPMLAGYLPIGLPRFDPVRARALVALTCAWRAPVLRLFAGNLGWHEAGRSGRMAVLSDLDRVADMAAAAGVRLAVETHPDTLADSPETALAVLAALNHPAVGLNFDALHVWESGADPAAARAALAPRIWHHHLKSVTRGDRLDVFDPANIHDPDGRREGLCPLLDGALDYHAFLAALPDGAGVSLEWFGPDPGAVMAADLHRIRALTTARAA